MAERPPPEAAGTPGSLAAGNAEALLLDIAADLVLTDDAAAPAAAQQRGLEVMGTVGVLIEAWRHGLIPAALPLLLELRGLGQWVDKPRARYYGSLVT